MTNKHIRNINHKAKLLYYRLFWLSKKALAGKRKFVAIPVVVLAIGIIGFVLLHKPSERPVVAAVDQAAEVVNKTRPSSNTALKDELLKWQKQVRVTPSETDADTSTIEKIPDNQVYQSGSIQVPPGWKIQYSTTTAANPQDADYNWQDEEPSPASSVTYLRFKTDTVTTVKPAVQDALTKPLNTEQVPSVSGVRTAVAKEYQGRMFTIYRAVDVENGLKDNGNGTNDSSDMTISCLDLRTYKPCSDDSASVTFPTYMSSASGTKLGAAGTPKDISTPYAMKYGFDSANGHLYIPAQKGNTYGVNCIDLGKLENCGYTQLGSSPAPAQAVGQNPVLLSGFAEKDGKLYGHANYNNGDTSIINDYLQMVCFDMATQSRCSGYTSDVFSNIPSMYTAEHANKFDTPGQHLMLGDRYYFLMNYDFGNANLNTLNKTQSYFGNRLVCYDVVQKSNCSSWPSSPNVETYCYWAPNQFAVWKCDYQTVQGKSLGEDVYQTKRPTQLFFWKGTNGANKAICISSTKAQPTTVDPVMECVNPTTGANYSETVTRSSGCWGNVYQSPQQETNTIPRCILPSQWLNVPWEPAPGVVEVADQSQGLDRVFLSWHIAAQTVFGGKDKAAVICYDWKLEKPCDNYRWPHYWYEIKQADTNDASYILDKQCIIGVSSYDFLWSFDVQTGETPCRHNFNKVTIKPRAEVDKAFCDGRTRTPKWGYLRINRADLHNFNEAMVTVKDKNGNVVNGLQSVDLKSQPGQRIDLSGLVYGTGANQYDELQIEVDSDSWNTSSWPIDWDSPTKEVTSYPLATVVMDTGTQAQETAQYCYQTKIKDYCDIDKVLTTSSIKSETANDILQKTVNTAMTVIQPPNVQCFRDLKISVTPDKTRVGKEEPITYTLTVTNQANEDPYRRGDITGATIEATVPAGATVVDSGGGTLQNGKVRWTNIDVQAGRTVTKTFKIKAPSNVTSAKPSKGKVYAATVEQPINVQAQVIYGDDYNQSDNSSSNSIILAADIPDEQPPTDDGGGTETGTGTTTPPAEPSGTQGDNTPQLPVGQIGSAPTSASGGSGSRAQYTPKSLKNFVPLSLQEPVESVFGAVYKSVEPIPPKVAVVLPYGTIAVLVALASVYVYQFLQEVRQRRRLVMLMKRMQKTEESRKNYLNVTSHYLMTPITKMQSTVDLLKSMKQLPEATAEKIKKQVQALQQHTKQLLTVTQEPAEHADIQFKGIKEASTRSYITSPTFLMPVVGVLLITVFFNAVFVWSNKYQVSLANTTTQAGLFALGAVAMVVTYRQLQRQKLLTSAVESELKLEQQIANSQTSLIDNGGGMLLGDIVSLSQLAPSVVKLPHGEAFANGIQSMKAIVSKMTYLSALKTRSDIAPMPDSMFREVMAKVVDDLEPSAKKKKVTLKTKLDKNLSANIDKAGLKQLLSSTIDNGIKFNNEKGSVTCTVERAHHSVVITVEDTGVGIPKEKLRNLFEPFGRGTDTLTYDYEGIGLDLYMDKLILESFGGTIDIDSKEGKGTVITMTIPSNRQK